MVNKFAVVNCASGCKTGKKKSSFHFLEDRDLNEKGIYFVIRESWLPSKNSAICIFESSLNMERKNVNSCGN